MSLRDRVTEVLRLGYRVERELGGGGMSHVFVAEELALGRRVVVKVLPPEMAATVNAERFAREIRTVASLQHTNIVPLLAAGGTGDVLWFTMPLIEGEELRARLTREGRLPVGEAVRLWGEVLDALAHAHAKGVIHRDVKPENVLLSGRHALVADFGVSKALSSATGERASTMTGVSIGTPAYMAPEQGVADAAADHRVDLYAAGLVMYEMLTGRGPFPDRTPVQLLVAHATEMPEPVRALRPEVSEALEALVMQCLAKAPEERPASAADALAALAAIAAVPSNPSGASSASVATGASGARPAAPSTPPVTRPWRRRAAVAGVVLAALAGGAYFAAPSLLGGGAPTLPDSARLRVFVLPVQAEAADSLLARSLVSAVTGPMRDDQRLAVTSVEDLWFIGNARGGVSRDSALTWLADLGTQVRVDLTLARAGTGYVASVAAIAQAAGTSIANEQAAAASAADLPAAIEGLRDRVMKALLAAVGRVPRAESDGALFGSTPQVARLVSDADQRRIERDYAPSVALYRSALRSDSTHPIALIGLYWSLANAGLGTDERLRAVARAYRHRDRMPFPDAQLLVAGEYHRALAHWDSAVVTLETFGKRMRLPVGDNQLGLAYGSARRYDDAVREFARARDTTHLAPSFSNSNYVSALLDVGREQEAREEYDRLRAGAGPDHPVTKTVQFALLTYGRLHDSIAVIAEADIGKARTAAAWSNAVLRRLNALEAVGRVREAQQLRLDRAARLGDDGQPAGKLANQLTHADQRLRTSGDTAEAARLVDEALRATPLSSLAPMDRPYSTAIQVLSHVGRFAEARRISEEADREIPDEFKPAFAQSLAATRLELELGERRVEAAIAEVRKSDRGVCAPCRFADFARVWDMAGQSDSALHWFERFINAKSSRTLGFDAIQLAMSYRRAGELYEAKGEARKAIERYRQFVELWKNADSDLQPQVRAIRERIARLERGIG